MTWRNALGTFVLGHLLATSALAQDADLVVSSDELVEIKGSRVLSSLVVEPRGQLRVQVTSLPDADSGLLELVANLVEVQSEGAINASETIGKWDQKMADPENHGGNGGSYGGRGGAGTPEEYQEPYGTATLPDITFGSFGGDGPGHVRFGGRPGGALTIRAQTVQIDGTIECDGQKGQDWSNNPLDGPDPERLFGAGGGSGGGILILAKDLTIGPNARITANGGNGGDGSGLYGGYEGYPGGGGRIKIFYQEAVISESAVINAKRGTPPQSGSYGGAEDGTVHVQQVRSIDQLLNPGDLNNDGVTNHEDLFLLQQSWQQELTPIPGPEETPTPTATPAP